MKKGTEISNLERENKILKLKASHSLANNLCPDHRDKQGGKDCLACEIERLKGIIESLKDLRPEEGPNKWENFWDEYQKILMEV